jgi:hypothetical protein
VATLNIWAGDNIQGHRTLYLTPVTVPECLISILGPFFAFAAVITMTLVTAGVMAAAMVLVAAAVFVLVR